MQLRRDENPSHHDHLAAAEPAVDVHGRAVTANRQAQRAADSRRATTALRLAVSVEPAFGLAVADLNARTGTASQGPSHHSPAISFRVPPRAETQRFSTSWVDTSPRSISETGRPIRPSAPPPAPGGAAPRIGTRPG